MLDKAKTLLTFPCIFPVKIFGLNQNNFIECTKNIIYEYFPTTPTANIAFNLSQNERFIAITARLYVEDKSVLNDLFLALKTLPELKMVL
ncbi:MAG: hypothetical protein CMF38_00345 [Legionellaceae bacterium]|nr:hypothetical protein [Legionellaceae bacterium]HAF87423.1 hypothetical protein [Legionellales bacterium]HCA89238.1 hypothetical protein [Legionellales bacterium]|tara:strand:+ start:506 stop:775 length:270 start_codon:yes stop_codon:yes gene_type:complete